MKMNKRIIITVFVILIITLAGLFVYILNDSTKEMPYNTFLSQLENRQVKGVALSDNSHMMKVTLKREDSVIYQVVNPDKADFVESLLRNDVEVSYTSGAVLPASAQFIMVAGFFGIIIYGVYGKQKSIKLKDENEKTNIVTTLSDVAGNAEAKYLVSDIIHFIEEPKRYSEMGARMPRGVLLYGPPGTGKTLMAKAIAGEAGVSFYAMSGSDFVETYIGVGAKRVRELFTKAKKSKHAVIFIDEIDAIGKKRGGGVSAGHDERDQTLNALLTEMSGFHEREGIMVIAATNRIDTLDEALLRPGRFDRQIEITLPDLHAREAILKLYCNNKPIDKDVNLPDLAKTTAYFSGAMLENLINEAAIYAANHQIGIINKECLDQSFHNILAGMPKNDRSNISEYDRRVTAYHEAGHALVTKLLLKEHTVSKVTIIPSTKGTLGFSLSIPKESPYMQKWEIEANVKALLAGRAAEEINFGEKAITTGAINDIEKASSLALNYLYQYGMDDEFGIFRIPEEYVSSQQNYLDRARERINGWYEEVKLLLEKHKLLLTGIAEALLENETLEEKDLIEIIQSY